MQPKTPVVLSILVEAGRLRWFTAAVRMDGAVTPLVRSGEDDLAICVGLSQDEQVTFLRHRFCGVVQRGCDRLWPMGLKACQFAFVFDGAFPDAAAELVPRVAEHFAQWMLNPPVVVFASGAAGLRQLAGTIDPPVEAALRAGLGPLFAAATEPAAWELSTRKGTWRPTGEQA